MENNLYVQEENKIIESVGIWWFIKNIWKHPLNTVWRVHSETSFITMFIICLVILLVSLFSTFVELAFPQNGGYQPAEIKDMMDAGHAMALVSSLDYFLLVIGFIIPYFLFRIIGKISEITLFPKLHSFLSVFGMLVNPFKILQEECVEIPVNVVKARKGLLFSVVPIVVGMGYLSFTENIFKFIMTPIYAKISPQYYDLGSIRNLSNQMSGFVLGAYFLVVIFFLPSIIFVFRR